MNKDDLISRQAAIDALNCNVQIRGEENAEAVKKMLSMFFENIMAIPSAQQWRTGEPSESGDYLCYLFDDFDKDRWFEVCSYYDTDGTAMGDFAGWRCGGIVLAWMPLPEPYEVVK